MNNDRLKFRIFYNGDYSITPYCTIDMNGRVWLDTSIMSAEGFGDPNTDIIDITDKCVVEQCTGLQDKNGNLIYEGDIVKVPDDWDEYGMMAGETREVYYKDGGFRLKPREFDIKRGARGHWLEDDKIFEIIGNIHTQKENS